MAIADIFQEVLFWQNLITAQSATGSPEFANTMIKNPATGVYKINITRLDPILVLTLDLTQIDTVELEYFNQFWYGGWGSAYGFRLHWPGDFYVINENIGTGDGTTKVFKLTKGYTRPGSGVTYSRRIIKPVVNSRLAVVSTTLGTTIAAGVRTVTPASMVGIYVGIVLNIGGTAEAVTVSAVAPTTFTATFVNAHNLADAVTGGSVSLYEYDETTPRIIPTPDGSRLSIPAFTMLVNGSPTTNYIVDNTAGVVIFNSAPLNGQPVAWSGEFDHPVRFLANSYQGKIDVSSEVTGIQFSEILGAELGIT